MFGPITQNNKIVYPIIFPIKYGAMKSINCFLYNDGSTLTLIDGGLNTPEFVDFFEQSLRRYKLSIEDIDQIFLTHHHEDHIGVVNSILSKRQIPIFAHDKAIPRLRFEKEFLTNKIHFFKKIYEEYGCLHLSANRFERMNQTLRKRNELSILGDIQSVNEGDRIGDCKVIEVPGHSPDSIIFYDESVGWQFAGDLLLENLSTNALIDFDDNLQLLPTVSQYENSLQKSLKLSTSWVFAGHENLFQNHTLEIQKKLQRMQKKETRIIEAVEKGYHITMDIAEALYGKRVKKEFIFIISEVIGYLEYAISRGKLEKRMENGQWYFRKLK
ncbi:glyoxylase-like metal-dependent hydrolase (beta-lactamase superfamily II) [Ureibacillus xyleni]|uniref:Glyoxylase-like metal-dependent hydrolase (Beta-lactamase superfamily II) n=1 Tax=Ureibacillus xyleni TaxID=614648 RepID=A0A285RD35_9BACL|nr:MBL fold metallo-hydrolase [Ureibacillus xyleni]SOB91990.1 glyoxylase-like metal-dependent hydrolase (beta-lactamase superfamily II) [Ureibacillus xyleni]